MKFVHPVIVLAGCLVSVLVGREFQQHGAAARGASTGPQWCCRRFAGASTREAIQAKHPSRGTPLSSTHLGVGFCRDVEVAYARAPHTWLERIGESLVDKRCSRYCSSFVFRLDGHTGHFIDTIQARPPRQAELASGV